MRYLHIFIFSQSYGIFQLARAPSALFVFKHLKNVILIKKRYCLFFYEFSSGQGKLQNNTVCEKNKNELKIRHYSVANFWICVLCIRHIFILKPLETVY